VSMTWRAMCVAGPRQWPTFGEFALMLDRAGAAVIPLSYLVFGLILIGAVGPILVAPKLAY